MCVELNRPAITLSGVDGGGLLAGGWATAGWKVNLRKHYKAQRRTFPDCSRSSDLHLQKCPFGAGVAWQVCVCVRVLQEHGFGCG